MSLTGRSTCVSASALSLDAQPAHVERVVSRISRPVCGMGIFLLNAMTSNQQGRLLVLFISIYHYYGVVVGIGVGSVVIVVFGNGKIN